MNADPSKVCWFKSSHSTGMKDCVEIAFPPDGTVAVRDSTNPTGPTLTFTAPAWHTFLTETAVHSS